MPEIKLPKTKAKITMKTIWISVLILVVIEAIGMHYFLKRIDAFVTYQGCQYKLCNK